MVLFYFTRLFYLIILLDFISLYFILFYLILFYLILFYFIIPGNYTRSYFDLFNLHPILCSPSHETYECREGQHIGRERFHGTVHTCAFSKQVGHLVDKRFDMSLGCNNIFNYSSQSLVDIGLTRTAISRTWFQKSVDGIIHLGHELQIWRHMHQRGFQPKHGSIQWWEIHSIHGLTHH